MSKNKTQTISVSTLVKKLLQVQNFLLFKDLPLYYKMWRCSEGKQRNTYASNNPSDPNIVHFLGGPGNSSADALGAATGEPTH